MATIKEVAELAGVSLTTVSRILNRDDSMLVTPEVRRRIFEAAYRLNYVTPRQKKRMSERQELRIGIADWWIVRPDRPNVHISSLKYTFEQMNDRYQVSFVRLTFGKMEEVDGIVALGKFEEEEIAFLRTLSPAIVFVNSNQKNYEDDQVKIDFERGEQDLVQYLISTRNYESIGYIGGIYEDQNVRIGAKRLSTFRRILEEAGKYEERFFHVGQISMESGYEMTMKAAAEGNLPKAVLLGSDEVAEGTLRAIDELGLKMPEDIAVVIYQDIQTLESKWQTSTCIEMFPDYVWENALEMLIGRMENKRTQAVTVVVPVRIRIGSTT